MGVRTLFPQKIGFGGTVWQGHEHGVDSLQ